MHLFDDDFWINLKPKLFLDFSYDDYRTCDKYPQQY